MACSIRTIAPSLPGRRFITTEWRLFVGAVMRLLSMSLHRLSAYEIQQPKPLLAWGIKADKPGESYLPIGIAITRQDELFVTDLNNARVQKFTGGGTFLAALDLPLDAPPRKSCIIGGIAVDEG